MKASIASYRPSKDSLNGLISREKNRMALNPVTLLFLILSLVGLYFSGMSNTFVANQVITRFVRNGILVLALIIPLKTGMGLNFAITLGALCTHGALIMACNWKIEGIRGIALILGLGILFSTFTGLLIGYLLNRARGKEMITSIIIGFVGNSLFQMIFMVGFGTIIPIRNPSIILSRGIGVRDMIDLEGFRNLLPPSLSMNISGIRIPLPMILTVLVFGYLVSYIMTTPLGQKMRAVGSSYENSKLLGIDSNRIRLIAVVISTVLASIGQFFYLQNIGFANVYTAQSNADIFASAALLAGGASIKEAKVRNAFLGIFLFHTLFIVSPQAGQNIFGDPALGEYLRSFIAYGTIAFAIIHNERKKLVKKIL